MECSVCVSEVVGRSCPYCSYEVCVKCVKRYLLDLTTSAKCMNCSKIWNREAIETVCGKSFLNGPYKKHREDLLFEREKALFPMTQPLVTEYLRNERIRKLISDIHIHMTKYGINASTHPKHKYFINLFVTIDQLRYNRRRQAQPAKPEKKIPTRKCPCPECKGFLDKKWVCQICTTHICKRCNEPKGASHTCDPGAIETMKLLKADTKGCPSCGCMISKISGCSQMWCIECHTTFDWNTLQIETGVVHNPHYFDYMRRNGGLQRQPGDIRCGFQEGLPGLFEVNMCQQFLHEYQMFQLIEIYRNTLDFGQYGHGRVPHALPGRVTLEQLRVKYMLNQVDEKRYRHLLQKHEKYQDKMGEMDQVRQMYMNVLGDLIRTLIVNKDFQTFLNQAADVKKYANEAYVKIASRYNCIVISIK